MRSNFIMPFSFVFAEILRALALRADITEKTMNLCQSVINIIENINYDIQLHFDTYLRSLSHYPVGEGFCSARSN